MRRRIPFPLAIAIPALAALMVAGIGIPFGLLFLEMHDMFDENVALIAALALTILIMLFGIVMSLRPEPNDPGLPMDSSGRPQRGDMTEYTGPPSKHGPSDTNKGVRRPRTGSNERRKSR